MLLAGGLGLLLPAAALPAREARVADERAVQALFLFHFTRFVEWPEDSFPGRDAPFRICIVGNDPFGPLLDRLTRGERAAQRTIAVERHRRPRDAEGCQIAYIDASVDLDDLSQLSGFGEGLVLTVGDSVPFLRRGGMVRFLVRDDRIALAISDPARQRSRLHVSSKLLQLSEIVRPEPPRGEGR